MAKNSYVGVGGIAKKIGKYYVGDENGFARKVTKGYVGDENGIARLCYQAHEHSYYNSGYVNYSDSYHYIVYRCACGDSYSGGLIAHEMESYGSWISAGASGCYKKTKCVCGKTGTTGVSAHYQNHYEDTVTEPTCTTGGYTTRRYLCCGYSKTIDSTPSIHATASASLGCKSSTTCAYCGETIYGTKHNLTTTGICTVCGQMFV